MKALFLIAIIAVIAFFYFIAFLIEARQLELLAQEVMNQ